MPFDTKTCPPSMGLIIAAILFFGYPFQAFSAPDGAYPPAGSAGGPGSGIFDSLSGMGDTATETEPPRGYPAETASRFTGRFPRDWKASGFLHPSGEGGPALAVELRGRGHEKFLFRVLGPEGSSIFEVLRLGGEVWLKPNAHAPMTRCEADSADLRVMNSWFSLSFVAFLFDFESFLVPEARKPFRRVNDGVPSLHVGMRPIGPGSSMRQGFEAFFSIAIGSPVMAVYPGSREILFGGTSPVGADWMPGTMTAKPWRGESPGFAALSSSIIEVNRFDLLSAPADDPFEVPGRNQR